MILDTIRAIYKINLGMKAGERVLIFTDLPVPSETIDTADACRRDCLRNIALLTAEVGRSFTKKVIYREFPALGSHGMEPAAELWEIAFGKKAVARLKKEGLLLALLKKELDDNSIKEAEAILKGCRADAVDAVIALSNYSTSHTRFRDFLTRICGCRYASMPLFDASMLEGSMHVDWRALARRTAVLEKIVNTAERIEISSPNGTHLRLSKKDRKALSDTGILTRKGAFGNLPAGEVFMAPVEGSAEGKLVLQWAPTRELSEPVTLTIKNGIVTDITGKEPFAAQLATKLSERRENRNIAELGIGTNQMAKRPDNILESEKILGTIHIALGDNSSFGGKVKTPFHQDFVVFKPTVTLITAAGEKIRILDRGAPLF
ncbi:MAG TPA: aminopeptidase [Dissulfurispiraceae bacterium]|nr:aminopeptidase [Dissulfurispiraceae bacterium]